MKGWLRRSACIAAVAIVFPAIVWTALATYRATFEPFGRDQGIFQYIAWAIARGDRAYVQVHDINGPLVPMIHLLFLKLGGADEHVFRALDFTLFGVSALAAGAMLPGIGERRGEPATAVNAGQRAAWALAAWVVLSAGYLVFGWWEHAQRESFFDDLLVPAVALELWALRPSTPPRARHRMFAIVGALAALTWFGKPSCLLYGAGLVLVIAVDDELPERPLPSVRAFALGCAAGCLPGLLFLLTYGDARAFARTMVLDVTRLHRYIWHKSIAEAYVAWGNAPKLNWALGTLLVGGVAIAFRALPRRFLAVLALLAGGLANFALQGKGFPYHLHPAVAGAHLLWLASAAYASERVARSVAGPGRGALLVGAGVLLLGYQSLTEARLSPAMQNDWYDDRRAGGAESELFLRHFNSGDYFAWDMHRAADYLRSVTREDDRVQTYAMDPYLLFLAKRRSATPYIYNFELNVDSALEGRPTERDRAWMIETAKRNAHDLFVRVENAPPAAFVAIDKVPYTFPEDAGADFATHCPEAAQWMRSRYRLAKRFGNVRVWLRNDR